jgi:hypothetical protein
LTDRAHHSTVTRGSGRVEPGRSVMGPTGTAAATIRKVRPQKMLCGGCPRRRGGVGATSGPCIGHVLQQYLVVAARVAAWGRGGGGALAGAGAQTMVISSEGRLLIVTRAGGHLGAIVGSLHHNHQHQHRHQQRDSGRGQWVDTTEVSKAR